MGNDKYDIQTSSKNSLKRKHNESNDKLSKRKKHKKKHKKRRTSISSSESEKHKKKSKKHKKKKDKKDDKKSESKGNSLEEEGTADIPLELMSKSKAMAPLTKEEWDKRQSVIRRVYDEESGRHRLIKGDGEVIEEIVSQKRHKEINKIATTGDGAYFQKKMNSKIS